MQISFGKPTWAVWFPFPYFCFEGMKVLSFMVRGTIDHIFGGKYEIVFVSHFTVLGLRLSSSYTFLRLYRLFSSKTVFTITGERQFTNLQISMAKLWIFLWWMENVLSLSSNFSSVDLWSEYIILSDYLWRWLILLFMVCECSVRINVQ